MECRQKAEADRLAVAVAAVAGGRLDRVPDGVTEVQDLTAAGVPLVGGHHGQLGPDAGEDHPVVELTARRHRLP